MGLWLFMLCMDALLPLTMLGFGRHFMKTGPRTMQAAFGYRTSRSMKNADTWQFAHAYCGKIWYVCGWVSLPVTAALLLAVLGKPADTVGPVGGLLCAGQLLLLPGAIPPTERALKRTFDQNGRRRQTPV